ncbi:ARM repeat-containing protein [Tilletiaria anomala UBC 951]|uniref:ARM repeat-containing protein n=1 Tax=Tilletiaria anomala (strain ATCC 24038 / CBS 436.72 / UBC 951) TaxID=1037660 RepID=A0A066WHT7_TILAU|nr:ARM repeat-containing protein [Tilletiaria anomala UBC 951]KDN53582.1 ARM repeat-containing protein [Tilletiaria anomala UBC 951]
MDEFPPGGGPSGEPDYSTWSIEDRLASKVWKARCSAYETLATKFSRTSDESDPAFKPYLRDADKLRAMVIDSNAVAQEKGVEAACKFVEFSGKEGGRTRATVLPAVVDKCLGSTRAGTKRSALELTLFYVEMEDVMGSEGIVTDVLGGLSSKQPKVVAACVVALKEMVKLFGPKQVSAKLILKRLPDIFAHSDKTVRAEGAELAKELYRYIGAAIDPTIDKLKDIQAKELRASFEQLGSDKAVPSRHILSEKAVAEAAAAAAAAAGVAPTDARAAEGDAGPGVDAGDAGLDAYDLAEAIDPFKAKEWPNDYEDLIASKKWSERRDALQGAQAALKASPKLSPAPAGQYDALVDVCAEKIKKDSNIAVACEACAVLELLAKGLRNWFGGRYKSKVLPPLLEKLKEKKQSVMDAVNSTLDAVFQTVTFSDILEDVIAGTTHKNPNVKAQSILFLARSLRTTRTPPAKADVKPIAEALVQALSDAAGEVRDAGAQGLGTLMKLVGERPMNQFIDQLDDIKKAKVKEEFANATVKVKMGTPSGTAPASRAPAAAAKPAPSLAPRQGRTSDKENLPPTSEKGGQGAMPAFGSAALGPKAPVARPPAKKPTTAPAKKPLGGSGPPKVGKPSGAAASATEPVKFRFTPEDAEGKAAELIPCEISGLISSANWKERLEGMTNFNTWLGGSVSDIESELVVRTLGKKPGWKESNFQVLSEVYKVLRQLADTCPTFGRASVALSVQPLVEKLGDIKLKTAAGDTMLLYAEKTSFGFLLAQALTPLAGLKAPKAIADSLSWVDQAILEFGFQGVDVRSLVDHLVDCLKSANAAVRSNATKVFGTVARYVGPALNTFIADINAQLKASIEAEIAKAGNNPPPAPTRFSAELQAMVSASAKAASGSAAPVTHDPLEDLVPRQSLEKLIPASAIAQLNHTNWKERKEGLEQIQSILEVNSRLKPEMNELTQALKLRYADSNMQVKTLALDVISRIATGMGKGFETHARTFVPPVTAVLADAKVPMRAAASAALTAMAEASTVAPMIPGFTTVLESKSANPMLKQDLFTWLATWFGTHPPEKPLDLAPLAQHAVFALDDKLAAVRKAAQAALPFIMARAGYKFVMDQTNSLKAASRNSVIPLIDAAKAQMPAMAAGPKGTAQSAEAKQPPASTRATSVAQSKASVREDNNDSAAPAPAATIPKTSTLKPGLKAPSAVGRSLRAPTTARPVSTLLSSDDGPHGMSKSRLGMGKRPTSAAQSGSGLAKDGTSPIITADLKFKAAREKKESRGVHWIGPDATAKPELADFLRAQCEHHFSNGILDAMFSKDHSAERDFLAALTLLSDFVGSPGFASQEFDLSADDVSARLISNADLLFKYITLRLTDNNTSISLKCLDILDHLVDVLREQRYNMSDYEASLLLPCVVAKFGDPKIAFRDRIREILRKLGFIFPPSKLLFRYLEEGLQAKNMRVRVECLGEVGYIFAKNGLHVCTPAKVLPLIAKQIGDRDANVRQAALGALSEAYKIVGDDVYGLCGDLPGKERSMLEERLKRVPTTKGLATAASKAATQLPGSRLARPSLIMASGSGIGRPRQSTLPKPAPAVSSLAPKAPQSALASNDAPAVEPVESEDLYGSGQEDEEDDMPIEQCINEITSTDAKRASYAMQHVEHYIKETDPVISSYADQLIIVLGKAFRKAFAAEGESPELEKLRRHLLVTLTSFFANDEKWDGKPLGAFVTQSALGPLLTELLQWLIEATRAADEEPLKKYSKILNVLVLRSFSTCEVNVLYDTCFSMLAEATEDFRELSPALLSKRAKFADLIIKCVWKITKALPDFLQNNLVDPSRLLLALERLFQVVPPNEWKARARDGLPISDLPLKTLKIILTHVHTALGEDVLNHLDLISEPENSTIYPYLVRLVNRDEEEDRDDALVANVDDSPRSRAKGRRTPPTPASPQQASKSTPMSPASTSMDDEPANAELLAIFGRISQKDQSSLAIKDLYEFTKKYPHKFANVEKALQNTGPIFQRYIKRALARHAAEDEEAGQVEAGT